MKRIILFAFLTFLTSACLEYKEKMQLNYDGSGEIKFAIGLSESLFNMSSDSGNVKDFDEAKIKNKYRHKKGIKFIGSKSYNESGDRWIEINLAFDSIEELMDASKDSSNFGMIGTIKLSEDNQGNMIFERSISSGGKSSEIDSSNSGFGKNVVDAMFSGYKWNYELTLPGKIISSNADKNDIDEKTNTVKWHFSMGSLSNASTMSVTFAKSSSTNLTLLILLVLGAIVLGLVLLYLLKLKRDEEVHVK